MTDDAFVTDSSRSTRQLDFVEFQVGTVLTVRDLGDGAKQWSVEFDDNGIPWGPVVNDSASGGSSALVPEI